MATVHICDVCGERAEKLTALVVSIGVQSAGNAMADFQATIERMQGAQPRLLASVPPQWSARTREFCDRESCRVKAMGEAWEKAYAAWAKQPA